MANNKFFLLTFALLAILFITGFLSTTSTTPSVVHAESVETLFEGSTEEMNLDSLSSVDESSPSTESAATTEQQDTEEDEEEIAAETLSDEGEVLDTLDSLPTDESANFESVDEDMMEDFGEDDEDINEGEAY
ncbi:hypothetical protein FDP41_013634 [Naegleria fowleri]|uniref:Uncharacterized protein n=1 Tax=Naegleria fowleri TaxID=5763 RepID=A0A6A5C3I2_NAEFO|nr:uncharacterized protein FDP41_013634 [Naegleria fowleri]KAF0980420.1 hypothetical protein FDP41_013634 [Naegleria fowleri]CAG4710666.1 unnamed protein product [Naegleria fowleri]